MPLNSKRCPAAEYPTAHSSCYSSRRNAAYLHKASGLQVAACAGVAASEHTAFVLVAGGLGERLGYSDIKVKLPVDSARGASFLQVQQYLLTTPILDSLFFCTCKGHLS